MRFLVVLCTLCMACGKTTAARSGASQSVAGAEDDFRLADFEWPERGRADFELGDEIEPTAYDLELHLPPSRQAAFTGRVRIDLSINSPVSTIWLHAVDLDQLEGHIVQGGTKLAISSIQRKTDIEQIGVGFFRKLEVGPAVLELSFRGRTSDLGIFRRGASLFTQFEPTHARQAFPCFDEPRFKTPWKLALIVDQGMAAFSNTAHEKVEFIASGRQRFAFKQTQPLPSYLVAFAAGPLLTTEAPGASVPMRVVSEESQRTQVSYAAANAPALLAAVEEYVGMKSPYPKLDLAVVRDFMFGGMENPGLITIADYNMLSRTNADDEFENENFRHTATHEFAHLWFGDSVTMKSWHDVWLNESLATWLTDKLVGSRGFDLQEWRMQRDAYPWAKAIRHRPTSVAETRASWTLSGGDMLVPAWTRSESWQKGAALLTMLEGLVGEKTLQAGLRRYLGRHANGSATAQDLAVALSEAARRDLRPMFKSYLEQAGLPTITGTLECAGGEPMLTLQQERYRLFSDSARPSPEVWEVPVCIRHSEGDECFLVSKATQQFELSSESCPTWFHLNRDRTGYYRFQLPEEVAIAIAEDHGAHREAELVSLAQSLTAGIRSGRANAGHALAVLSLLADSDHTEVVRASIAGYLTLAKLLGTKAEKQSFSLLVAKTYGPRALRLLRAGTSASQSESELAQILIPLVGLIGRDKDVRAESRRINKGWLQDPKTSDATRSYITTLAGEAGDSELVSHVLGFASARPYMHDIQQFHWSWIAQHAGLFEALGALEDPKRLLEAFAAASKSLPGVPIAKVLPSALGNAGTRKVAFAYYRENYERLKHRVDLLQVIRSVGGVDTYQVSYAFCTDEDAEQLASFVHSAIDKRKNGGPFADLLGSDLDPAEETALRAVLAANVENIKSCAQLRRHHHAGLQTFLLAD